jgi:hypothetical protein
MSKIIITEINNCHECKYCHIPRNGDPPNSPHQCTNIYNGKGEYCAWRIIEDFRTIPSWCQLLNREELIRKRK